VRETTVATVDINPLLFLVRGISIYSLSGTITFISGGKSILYRLKNSAVSTVFPFSIVDITSGYNPPNKCRITLSEPTQPYSAAFQYNVGPPTRFNVGILALSTTDIQAGIQPNNPIGQNITFTYLPRYPPFDLPAFVPAYSDETGCVAPCPQPVCQIVKDYQFTYQDYLMIKPCGDREYVPTDNGLPLIATIPVLSAARSTFTPVFVKPLESSVFLSPC
jgi:hypothetical protein